MPDPVPAPLTALRPSDVDVEAVVAALPDDVSEQVRLLVRERDALFVLHEALLAAERAPALEEKLRRFVAALTTLGFGRAVLTLRDEALPPTRLVAAGLSDEEERALREGPSEGDAWRRRMTELERFRVSQSFYVPGSDPFAQREFGDALRSTLEAGEADPLWSPRDTLIVPLRGADGRLLATLILDDPTDRRRPTVARIRVVELFAQQMAWVVEQAHLGALAERRAARLQRLQEAGARLATSLDEREIARELAEHARDMLGADAVVCAFPDIERGRVPWAVAVNGDAAARPAGPASLDPQGAMARAVRSGRPTRVPAAEGADVIALAYGVGSPEARAPGTILAVPLTLGARMLAVLALHAGGAPPWSDEDEEMLRTVAAQAAAAIANARLYAESERERRQSEALSEIARAVSESLRLGEVMPLILRHAAALLRGSGATLSLRRGDELEIVSAVGEAEPQLGMRLPIRESMSGRVLERLLPMHSNDAAHDTSVYRPAVRIANVRRAVAVPLVTGRGSLGVLSVINRPEDFTEVDVRVLQRLADAVAVAVVNAQLFEEVSAKNALAERYRHAVEAASDAIVITDRRRRILFTNPAARHLFALEPEALVGRQLDEFAVPEAAEHAAALERALAGAPQRYDAGLRRPYGERFSVSVSAAPLRDAAGEDVSGLVVSLRDVTAERRARDAVAHSEARYRNLFETATDAIYTLDPRGSFTSVNHAVTGLTALPRAELLGRSILPFLAPEEVAGVRKNFRTALAGQPTHYECHLVRPDGERRLMSVTNTPIRQGREVVGVLGIARDVTDERDRVRELARSEARYTRLVESASDAIFTVDETGCFTSVNRAMERALGQPRDALLGLNAMAMVDPADREIMAAIMDATLRGQRQRGELRYAHYEGVRRTGSIITAPITEEGRVTGALGVVRDVTDEKRLGDQLLQQEKLAAIGQLVSGVAHELNNPLAGAMAFAQLLLASSNVQGDDRFAAETIHQESKRAAKIVSNLLTFARQHPPERRVADLNRVVQDTLELRRYALRMEQIELAVALDDDLPLTWADPFQLQQVVLNLITNAEQALAEWDGTRRVRIATFHRDDDLVLTVADSGPGIEPDAIDRIFNPFYTTKPVGQGTGLGLSISDGIVREHGGRIRVESQPGQGATFIVELPVVAPEIMQHPRPDGAAHGRSGSAPAPTSGLNVLVVDDEPAIRSAVSTFLRGEGHVVDTAGSGVEALERLGRRRYDAVLLDLRMPDTSGDALFLEMRRRDASLARRVVFVTGDVQDDSPAREAIAATGLPVLLKPFTFEDLADALRAVGVDGAAAS